MHQNGLSPFEGDHSQKEKVHQLQETPDLVFKENNLLVHMKVGTCKARYAFTTLSTIDPIIMMYRK